MILMQDEQSDRVEYMRVWTIENGYDRTGTRSVTIARQEIIDSDKIFNRGERKRRNSEQKASTDVTLSTN